METTQAELKTRKSSKTRTPLEEAESRLKETRKEDIQLIEKYELLEIQMIKTP